MFVGCAPNGEDFCPSNVVCGADGCPETDSTRCIDFDEAAELAKNRFSGIHTVVVTTDPPNTGAAIPTASNADATCKAGTCYTRREGVIAIYLAGSPGQAFDHWSGCEIGPDNELTNVTHDEACVVHWGAAIFVVHASVVGWPDAHVQVTSEYGGCSGADSCAVIRGHSVTFTAPMSDTFEFRGWSGCSTSKEFAITLDNVTTQPPECVANYAPRM
jgi:hypothetical protein